MLLYCWKCQPLTKNEVHAVLSLLLDVLVFVVCSFPSIKKKDTHKKHRSKTLRHGKRKCLLNYLFCHGLRERCEKLHTNWVLPLALLLKFVGRLVGLGGHLMPRRCLGHKVTAKAVERHITSKWQRSSCAAVLYWRRAGPRGVCEKQSWMNLEGRN